MYLQNKYTTWYFSIISNAKSRNITEYTEQHHIVPVSLGGKNNKDNLVRLTAREHYICHLLLVKMTQGIHKKSMSYALWMMTNASAKHQLRYTAKSKLYEFARKNFVESQQGHKPTLFKQSEQTCQQISKTMKTVLSTLTPEQMRERMLNSCHKPESWTEERKQNISKSTTGVKKTKTPALLEAKKATRQKRTERLLTAAAINKGRTWQLINGKRVWMEKE